MVVLNWIWPCSLSLLASFLVLCAWRSDRGEFLVRSRQLSNQSCAPAHSGGLGGT
jgi:hypothetical protein